VSELAPLVIEHIEDCDGDGRAECGDCIGEGEYAVTEGGEERTYRCDTCNGKGWLPCPGCKPAGER
jgi:DnaJ-class molecular chaperone